MKNSAEKITCGDFKALRKITALTGIEGEWTKDNDPKIIINIALPMERF